VNFLVDAQLPRLLAVWLKDQGHDAIHTLDLPAANRTTDKEIRELADREQRIVVTKDSGFVDSHVLTGSPAKLLLIATGNIGNNSLIDLLATHSAAVFRALETSDFVELTADRVILHD
jgi:predicted nuclease of predicted toxin-antitoxin system